MYFNNYIMGSANLTTNSQDFKIEAFEAEYSQTKREPIKSNMKRGSNFTPKKKKRKK